MAYKVSQEEIFLFKSCYRQIAKIQVLGIEGLEEIKESDILQGGLTIDRYCFSSNALEIGTAIASEATLELKNADGRFDGYTFDGAKLIIHVGIKKWNAKVWENATMHYVPLGVFTIDEKTKNKSNITLNALDNMVKFDREYDTTLAFPATLGEIVEDACSRCGVLLKTTSFYNSDYVVNTRPTDDGLTYRQVIQWAAQLSCTNAFIDWDGQLRLTWFEDSGHIIPAADRYDSDMEEHSVLITGVKVTAADESEYTAGEKGSVLCIEGNSLAQSDAETIAKIIYAKVGNFTYLPYSSVCRPMPYLYPMDMITFVDRRGNEHKTIVSAVTYTMNGTTDVVGEGYGSTKGRYASTGSTTTHEKVIIEKAKKAAEKTSTGQFNMALALNETIAGAFGLYRTEIIENKVSTWYYHDKATLNDSTIIYVFNSGGFAWTEDWNDGNPTWQYGFSRSGNAIVRLLTANKIQSDQIEAGSITAEKLSTVGGFDIDAFSIRHGMQSLTDTENEGVYISPEGIALGRGAVKLTKAGAGSIGGWNITGDALYKDYTEEGNDYHIALHAALYHGADGSLTGQDAIDNSTVFEVDVNGYPILYCRPNGLLHAENAEITGRINTNEGQIGSWYIADGIMRSQKGVYGTYSYTTTGTDHISAIGYAFTELIPTGIQYNVKSENDYTSDTIAIINPFTGVGRSVGGGGTA